MSFKRSLCLISFLISALVSDVQEVEPGLDIPVRDELVHACGDRIPEVLPQEFGVSVLWGSE